MEFRSLFRGFVSHLLPCPTEVEGIGSRTKQNRSANACCVSKKDARRTRPPHSTDFPYATPLPLAGRGRIASAMRVRGTLHERGAWRLPLTPTLSPQAGRGSALPARRSSNLNCSNRSTHQVRTSSQSKKGGRSLCRPCPQSPKEKTYFRLVIAVRSTDSLAMPAAPHQLDRVPFASMPTGVPGCALKAPVKALQLAEFRSVSE